MPTTEETTVTIKAGGVETGPIPISDLKDKAGELFDGAQYDTPLPKCHGHRPDTIKLSFGGGLEIDLMDGQLVDYLKSLRLGQDVDLHVTGTISKVNWAHRNTGDDGGEKVTHLVGVSVHSIDLSEAS